MASRRLSSLTARVICCAAMYSVVLVAQDVHARSILGFSTIGARSHQAAIFRIGQELTARGHNFTLLLSKFDEVSDDAFGSKAYAGFEIMTFQGAPFIGTNEWVHTISREPQQGFAALQAEMLATAHALYSDKATLQRLGEAGYDVLIQDPFNWAASLLEDVLGVPSIEVMSFVPVPPIFSKSLFIPNPVAYLPQFGSSLTPNMTFLQRCKNFLQGTAAERLVMPLIESKKRQFMKESGLRVRSYEQGYSAAVTAISAADWAIEFPRPMPPNVQVVGPTSVDVAKPLPADLETFLEQGRAAQHGAIYISMGSAAKLTKQELQSLADCVSAMSNPVLWKLSALDMPKNMSIRSLEAPNIKFVSWAPQNDVLGHPSVKAFISHGGSNSMYEAAFHGVPLVCIPFFGDQPDNAAKAVYHGFGLTVIPEQLTAPTLTAALQRVLQEPHFKANALKVQKRLNNNPRHPVELAADIVERVMATGGDPYLNTKERDLTWWQLSLLDVKAFLLLVLTLMAGLLIGLLWLVARFLVFAAKAVVQTSKAQHNAHKKMI